MDLFLFVSIGSYFPGIRSTSFYFHFFSLTIRKTISIRDTLTTLDIPIGKTFDMVICLNPEIEVHYELKSKIPAFGVHVGNDIAYYVFKDEMCIDAFLIPNKLIPRLMSKELAEEFIKFGEMANMLKNNLTEGQIEVMNLLATKSNLN